MSRRISAPACNTPSSGGWGTRSGRVKPGKSCAHGGLINTSSIPFPPRSPCGGVSVHGSVCPMPACAYGGQTTSGLQTTVASGPNGSSNGSSALPLILVPQKSRWSFCCGFHGDAASTALWPLCLVSVVAAAAHTTANAALAIGATRPPTWAGGDGPKGRLCPRASQGQPGSSS